MKNWFQKILPILIIFVVVLGQQVYSSNRPVPYLNFWSLFFRGDAGEVVGVASSTPLPVSMAGSTTFNMNLNKWGVGRPKSYPAALSKTAKTSLSAIASYTTNDYVSVQVNAKTHFTEPGISTAAMQLCEYLKADERIAWRVGTNTFDIDFIADSLGVSSISITVYPMY